MENWGKRLALVMRGRKAAKRQIAQELNVTPQAVGKWLNSGEIEHRKLRRLAGLYGVNWVWLRYGDEALADATNHRDQEDRVAWLRRDLLSSALTTDALHLAACSVMNIGAWNIDVRLGINRWSFVTRKLLGADPREKASQSLLRDLVHDEDVRHIDETIIAALCHGRNTIIQRFRAKRRPNVWINTMAKVIRGEDNTVEQIVGVIYDDSCLLRKL